MSTLAATFSAPAGPSRQPSTAACPVCGADPIVLRDNKVGPHNEQRIRRGTDGKPEAYVSDQPCDGAGQVVA